MTTPLSHSSPFPMSPIESPIVNAPENKLETKSECKVNESNNPQKEPLQLLIGKVKAFMDEVKTFPDFPKAIPENRQNDLKELSLEVKQYLKSNPMIDFNKCYTDLEKQYVELSSYYSKQQSEMQAVFLQLINDCEDDENVSTEEKKQAREGVANMPLSAMTFDCGGLTKRLEAQMAQMKFALSEMKVIVDFMNSTDNLVVSEKQTIPLFDVISSTLKLIKAGIIEVSSAK